MRRILLDPNAVEDLRFWVRNSRKVTLKILSLIDESARDPF